MDSDALHSRIANIVARRDRMVLKRDQVAREIELLDADLAALQHIADRRLFDPDEGENGRTENVRHGDVARAVDSALPSLPAMFTIAEVLEALASARPDREFDRTSVSGCLRRLVDGGTIYEIEKGRGRKMSVYSLQKEPGPSQVQLL